MAENNSSAPVLDFGVGPAALIRGAGALMLSGTNYTKSGKLLACIAALAGAPVEDVAAKSGVALSELRRIVRVARGDSAAKVTEALRALDLVALTGEHSDAQYDASIIAARTWDSWFADKGKTRGAKEVTFNDLTAKFYDMYVEADPAKRAVALAALKDLQQALTDLAASEREAKGKAA